MSKVELRHEVTCHNWDFEPCNEELNKYLTERVPESLNGYECKTNVRLITPKGTAHYSILCRGKPKSLQVEKTPKEKIQKAGPPRLPCMMPERE